VDLREPVPIARFDQPRDLIEAFADALNAKDAESLGRLFSEGAEFVNVRGTCMHGVRASSKATPCLFRDHWREALFSSTQSRSCQSPLR
jgi:ketosteroid isomerase-like protein